MKKLTVREAEAISRRIATDRVRKHTRSFDPEMVELENKLTETLGTRVVIEKKEVGGKLTIDFFSADDLRGILDILNASDNQDGRIRVEKFISENREELQKEEAPTLEEIGASTSESVGEEDLYSIKNFSI